MPSAAPSNVCQTDATCSVCVVFATDAPECAGLVLGSVMSWRSEVNGRWRVQREAVLHGLSVAVLPLRRWGMCRSWLVDPDVYVWGWRSRMNHCTLSAFVYAPVAQLDRASAF